MTIEKFSKKTNEISKAKKTSSEEHFLPKFSNLKNMRILKHNNINNRKIDVIKINKVITLINFLTSLV